MRLWILLRRARGFIICGLAAWYCSPVECGRGGMVKCAHGTFPVPAPATADLLRGVPTYSAHVQKELATPTGAALLRALEPTFGPQPAMKVEQIGYGAGTRNFDSFPNVLRLSVGEAADGGDAAQTVTVIETALDDSLAAGAGACDRSGTGEGALDVMLTAVIMKEGPVRERCLSSAVPTSATGRRWST